MVRCCWVILHLCTCSLGITPFMHHLITSLELIVLHWEIQQSSNRRPNKKWLYSAWRVLIIHESDFGLLFGAYVEVIHSTSKVNVPQYLARVPTTAKVPPKLKHIGGVNMSIFATIFSLYCPRAIIQPNLETLTRHLMLSTDPEQNL